MHIHAPFFIERMFEEGVTVLNVLSISAIITTVSLFFCGIPICIKIWKQQSVGDISGMPFVTGVLGGVFWLRYGLLKFDLTMIVVNVVGVSLMTAYLIFYYVYSPAKKMITIQIMVICVLMSSMLIIVEFHGLQVIHPLGFVCMTFNILNFGAPLAGLVSCNTFQRSVGSELCPALTFTRHRFLSLLFTVRCWSRKSADNAVSTG
uniref:Sugar transporter SWEET1 n=1 Tax=Steinernema glaseri TaxID=37863 RepID=A0A1I7YRC6_9BILA